MARSSSPRRPMAKARSCMAPNRSSAATSGSTPTTSTTATGVPITSRRFSTTWSIGNTWLKWLSYDRQYVGRPSDDREAWHRRAIATPERLSPHPTLPRQRGRVVGGLRSILRRRGQRARELPSEPSPSPAPAVAILWRVDQRRDGSATRSGHWETQWHRGACKDYPS